MVNVIQYKQGRGKGGWQLSKSCYKLLVCRSRRSRKPNMARYWALLGPWHQPALWPGQEGWEVNTVRIGTGSYEQPGAICSLVWVICYMYTSSSTFHVPAGCPPASLLVIWQQETRSTLWPSTDLLSLETSQQSWLPPLVPMAEISVNSCTCLFPAPRCILSTTSHLIAGFLNLPG